MNASPRPSDFRPAPAPADAPAASVAVVGFGAFGRLVAEALAPHAAVCVHDRSPRALAEAEAAGFRPVPDLSGLSAEIVVLAVPLPALAEVLRAIAPHLRPGQLVLDVCSVKEAPARLLRDLLPPFVEILATHPMFGPQSARDGLAGRQIVLCPIRGRRWRGLARFLRRLGLEVLRATPEEHDRQAALSQGLTHLLAHAFASLGERPRIRTRSFELMSEALAMVLDDAPEVFEAVTRANPHVAPLRARLVEALSTAAPPARPGGTA
ncbi:prephenate dehydrogenase [Albimonas sp. CAU 1670]|uniref:prephenate dehydrogenase n=1 Tax=Albimonas sp. CAU 1670 TaxID=3032599 RepID=UPI0023DA74E0|nr:prephenate dehydrogenase [Albimonas sp. CAU 1670]MDF2233117.1 prephenate dehydrogenase [Albimonas sp. CAU 1670]